MSKTYFDKEAVLNAALELVREEGFDAVSARAVAGRAGCSVQPIYSQFGGMDGLMSALYEYGLAWVAQYGQKFLSQAPTPFAAAGRAHIFLAKEEPLLFSFLYQSPYMGMRSLEELFELAAQPNVAESVKSGMGFNDQQSHDMYLDMIVYTHGLASILVAGSTIPIEQIAQRMDGAFRAFAGLYMQNDGSEQHAH